MKKIMFNDKYGLTQAVLEGRKMQTRRIIDIENCDYDAIIDAKESNGKTHFTFIYDGWYIPRYPTYQIGEEVAVAQSYKDVENDLHLPYDFFYYVITSLDYDTRLDVELNEPGWSNKMFVKADLMPHRIKITNVRVERLQDISEEDCLKEGITHGEFVNTWDEYYFEHGCNYITAKTPCEAYKKLINRISGKGTWEKNPYVFVYDFEFIM